jgi:hypothetical protein
VTGGQVILKDFADDEEAGACYRLISVEEARWVSIHAGREARWHQVDVAGSRPIAVFGVLKRVLATSGFSVELVWGRPDMRRRAFRAPRPERCRLERQQMLGVADLDAIGLERPDSQPLMNRWTTSACHAALVDRSLATEPWVHGWDAEHPALLAQLFVEWEVCSDGRRSYLDLHRALRSFGPQAVIMYLLSTRYGELLPPIDEGLQMAKQHVKRINAALRRLRPGEPSPSELAVHVQGFEYALANDLDTPTAFLALFDWIREAGACRGRIGDGDLQRMLWLIGMSIPNAATKRSASRASADGAPGALVHLGRPGAEGALGEPDAPR